MPPKSSAAASTSSSEQIMILEDGDPLRSSLDRHLADVAGKKKSSNNKKEQGGTTHIGQIREAHGLCPSCGQQLFKIEQATGGFLSCCLGDPNDVKKVPLTIPHLVDRGQCLTCTKKQIVPRLSVADTASSGSTTSGSDDPMLLFPMPDHMEREPLWDPASHFKNLDKRKPPPPGSSNLKPPPPGSSSSSSLTGFRLSLNGSDDDNTVDTNSKDSDVVMHVPNASSWLPKGTAVYHGPYNKFGERHGLAGEMIWSNGDVYRGGFVNDKRQGHGTLTFAPTQEYRQDGGEYVGDWSEDEMHGSGTRRYPNGDVYMGDYQHGCRHGQGRFYYSNGDLYWGSWKSNQMHGAGRYYYASGQRFEGVFQGGKRTGKGKLQRTDGTLEIFQYVNDQRVGQGVRWSADRTKAWRLWMPSSRGSAAQALSKQKMSIAEAVSLVYEIEQAADCV